MPDHHPVIGPTDTVEPVPVVPLPRSPGTRSRLSDGHRVGIAVCGRGVPLVVVHGFSAEGSCTRRRLSRIVVRRLQGRRHRHRRPRRHAGPADRRRDLESYSRLLGRVIDELGIRRAVLAGHSMGGRLVTELAADEPDRAIAVILLDAIVGETWDRLVYLFRFNPALLAGIGVHRWSPTR